ncbi:MAG: DUF1588 domain-containing protein [Myxococcaceae bacterium]|nr:DUF1588 domain-containing protein [Myxococcaceae bacterium]
MPGQSGVRRLSRVELDTALSDLLGDTSNSAQGLLPPEPVNPFDNDYRAQFASAALIESVERLATDAANRALANATLRAALVPCSPKGPGDASCMRTMVQTVGRRVFRRPLTGEEVDRFMALQTFAVEDNNFDTGVRLVLQAMLQHPAFLYRVELGTPLAERPGTFKLSNYEMATRLSFFLWGSTPPDWLLDDAANDKLADAAGIRAAVDQLLADPRAKRRLERFHALWLAYAKLPHPAALTNALQAESAALVDKVLFTDRGDYFELFRSSETYVNSTLAAHYGMLGAPASGSAWLPYGPLPRMGLLSQGAVLSAGAKFSDTSPTQRGIFVRTRLLCQDIAPPPSNANVDEPPTSPSSNCKVDRYSAHASTGNCKSCHQSLDPIGFGLENFDREGKYRAHDDNEPNCPISGDGKITGLPGGELPFRGAVGLANLLTASPEFEQCVVTQLYRFNMGRKEDPADLAFISALTEGFRSQRREFQTLLKDFVSHPTFAYRVEE